jgi:pyruvate carboxylase
LTCEDVIKRGEEFDFPESVVDLFMGYLGYPHHGLPKDVQTKILKGKKPITARPVCICLRITSNKKMNH